MGGQIDVHSVPGEGSRFWFRLALPRGSESAPPADGRQAAAVLQARLAALGRPMRVLLAEDNPTNQFVVIRLLKGLPIKVDVAQDGAEAVAEAARTAYDMICMDMRMPEMDGLEATRVIRRREGPSRQAADCGDDGKRVSRGHGGVPRCRDDRFRCQAGQQGPVDGGYVAGAGGCGGAGVGVGGG